MLNCPCCSDILLRHTRSGQAYLLCQGCRIELPDGRIEQSTPLEAKVQPRVFLQTARPQTLTSLAAAART